MIDNAETFKETNLSDPVIQEAEALGLDNVASEAQIIYRLASLDSSNSWQTFTNLPTALMASGLYLNLKGSNPEEILSQIKPDNTITYLSALVGAVAGAVIYPPVRRVYARMRGREYINTVITDRVVGATAG